MYIRSGGTYKTNEKMSGKQNPDVETVDDDPYRTAVDFLMSR